MDYKNPLAEIHVETRVIGKSMTMKKNVGWSASLSALLLLALPHASQAQHANRAPPAGHAATPAPAPSAKADSTVLRQVDVMVPARDGILLATDIYRPAKAGVAL